MTLEDLVTLNLLHCLTLGWPPMSGSEKCIVVCCFQKFDYMTTSTHVYWHLVEMFHRIKFLTFLYNLLQEVTFYLCMTFSMHNIYLRSIHTWWLICLMLRLFRWQVNVSWSCWKIGTLVEGWCIWLMQFGVSPDNLGHMPYKFMQALSILMIEQIKRGHTVSSSIYPYLKKLCGYRVSLGEARPLQKSGKSLLQTKKCMEHRRLNIMSAVNLQLF